MIERALRPRLDMCLTEPPPTREQLAFTMDQDYASLQITEYAEAFVENGYGNVARLVELFDNVRTRPYVGPRREPEFTTFLTAVGMTKPGHIHRFVSYMERRADRPWVRNYQM